MKDPPIGQHELNNIRGSHSNRSRGAYRGSRSYSGAVKNNVPPQRANRGGRQADRGIPASQQRTTHQHQRHNAYQQHINNVSAPYAQVPQRPNQTPMEWSSHHNVDEIDDVRFAFSNPAAPSVDMAPTELWSESNRGSWNNEETVD